MKVFLSEKADERLKNYIKSLGAEIELVSSFGNVDDAIACHPDVYYCSTPKGIYKGNVSLLTKKYPGDVLYNAACVGKYIICSRYTSKDLIEKSGLEPLVVPQGYVKCNLVVVDSKSVITEDEGIAKVLKNTDIDCLLVRSCKAVLPGYKNGFIGGCSGRIRNEIVFNGNLKACENFESMAEFIGSRGLTLKFFEDYPLTDIGSIIAEV